MTAGRNDPRVQRLKPLAGRTFAFQHWQATDPDWTHDHCRGCRAHICSEIDNDYYEAYVTTDPHGQEDWVCPKCFDLYRFVLTFKVAL